MDLIARRNNREFSFTTVEDFDFPLAPSADLRADAPDSGRGTQHAVRSPAFVAPYVPRRGRRRIGTMPSQNHEVRA